MNDINEIPFSKVVLMPNGRYATKCSRPECAQMHLLSSKMNPNSEIRVFRCVRCGTNIKIKNPFFSHFSSQSASNDDPSNKETSSASKDANRPRMPKCTQCGKGFVILPSEKAGKYESKCDSCGHKYTVEIQSDGTIKADAATVNLGGHIIDEDAIDTSLSPLDSIFLTLVTGKFRKKRYVLREGTHYVGRADEDAHSDFEINDMTVSRRSLRIDVEKDGLGSLYKMTVKKATNPVYLNKKLIEEGKHEYLNFGDIITVGKTNIRVEEYKK